jgi:hypothetical protein
LAFFANTNSWALAANTSRNRILELSMYAAWCVPDAVAPFPDPEDALPGSLSLSHLRCGKSTCHCAEDRGHPVWSLTFMVKGKKHVQHIPKQWVEARTCAGAVEKRLNLQ